MTIEVRCTNHIDQLNVLYCTITSNTSSLHISSHLAIMNVLM